MTEHLQMTVQITPEMIHFTGRCNDLTRELNKRGIPFIGFSKDRIDFDEDEDVTQEQMNEANQVLAEWDWDILPVPPQITATQAKLALYNSNLYDLVYTKVAEAMALPGGMKYQIIWEAANWFRDSRELNELAAQVPLTDEQIDNLFRYAATIV